MKQKASRFPKEAVRFALTEWGVCDKIISLAGMVELADTLDLGSSGYPVQVQVLLPAPSRSKLCIACSGFFHNL